MKKILALFLVTMFACVLTCQFALAQEKEVVKAKPAVEKGPLDEEKSRFRTAMNEIRKEEMAIIEKFNSALKAKIDEAVKANPDAKPEVDLDAMAATYKDQFKAIATKEIDEELNHKNKMSELAKTPEAKAKMAEKLAERISESITKQIQSLGSSEARSARGRARGFRKAKDAPAPAVEAFDKGVDYNAMVNQDKIKEFATLVVEERIKNEANAAAAAGADKEKLIERKCDQKVKQLARSGSYLLRRGKPVKRPRPERKPKAGEKKA